MREKFIYLMVMFFLKKLCPYYVLSLLFGILVFISNLKFKPLETKLDSQYSPPPQQFLSTAANQQHNSSDIKAPS